MSKLEINIKNMSNGVSKAKTLESRMKKQLELRKVMEETISMDYEKAYHNLLHQYQTIANENEGLKKAVIKLASIDK